MVLNPCAAPVEVAHAVVRGVADPVAVVVVAEAHRGVAAVVVVDAEVRAAAADDLKFDGRRRFGGVFLSGRQA